MKIEEYAIINSLQTYMAPRTILTHLIDGNPEWIKVVRFSNRSIKAVFIPRFLLKEALEKRGEVLRSWIYFPFWEKENGDNTVYVWQAINLSERLKFHSQDPKKDFWNHIVCFTTNWDLLDSAEINYLESKSIEKIRAAWRILDENGNRWNKEHLDEFKIPDMNEYLDDLSILLSHIGYPVFIPIIPKWRINIQYILSERWTKWCGYLTEEWFIVLSWSRWPLKMQENVIKNRLYAFRNRPKLLEQWVIKEVGDEILFLKDHLFWSPGGAADFLTWWSYNLMGRLERSPMKNP